MTSTLEQVMLPLPLLHEEDSDDDISLDFNDWTYNQNITSGQMAPDRTKPTISKFRLGIAKK